MTKTEKLRNKIASEIIVDCGFDSEYPCPHIEPYMGWDKCKHEDKDICIWQERQANEFLLICKEAGLKFVNIDVKFGEFTPIDPIEVE